MPLTTPEDGADWSKAAPEAAPRPSQAGPWEASVTSAPPALGITRFDAAGLAQRFDDDVQCTTRRCSVQDAGWLSVLVRVAQRSDASGRVDMGVLPHPRIMLVTRGTVAVQRRDGAVRRSAHLAPGKAWLVPPNVPLSYEWTRAGCGIRELSVLVISGEDLERTAAELSGRRSAPVSFTEPVLAEDHVVRSTLTGLTQALAGRGRRAVRADLGGLPARPSAQPLRGRIVGPARRGQARRGQGGHPGPYRGRVYAGQSAFARVALGHSRQRRAQPVPLPARLSRLDGPTTTLG